MGEKSKRIFQKIKEKERKQLEQCSLLVTKGHHQSISIMLLNKVCSRFSLLYHHISLSLLKKPQGLAFFNPIEGIQRGPWSPAQVLGSQSSRLSLLSLSTVRLTPIPVEQRPKKEKVPIKFLVSFMCLFDLGLWVPLILFSCLGFDWKDCILSIYFDLGIYIAQLIGEEWWKCT